MFRPIPLYIGLRYTRARRRNHFISFISLTSVLGIALGVMVLITVLSVMNGFDDEIQSRVFGMAPQITVRNFSNEIPGWNGLAKRLSNFPGVEGCAPFVMGQGMLSADDVVQPVLIDGVNPSQEMQISQIANKVVSGKFNLLKPGAFGIVLGQTLADNLGVALGDKVTLVIPQASVSPMGFMPRFKRFSVVGIFNAGNGFGFDSQLAYINMHDAQKLYQMNDVSGIRLKVANLYQAPVLSDQIAKTLTSDFYVTNWTSDYGPLFKAIKLEKTMMFLILMLIVAVAAFNLVASLVMVVNEKRADIAILRTLGATPRMIMGIFMVQGFIVGLFGTIAGVIAGILLALNVTPLVSWLEKVFHVQLFSTSVYYVNYLPSKLDIHDVLQICLVAFLLCLIATIYPAYRAAKTQPAEALRYE